MRPPDGLNTGRDGEGIGERDHGVARLEVGVQRGQESAVIVHRLRLVVPPHPAFEYRL